MADTISINGYSLNATHTVPAGTVAVTVLGDSPILLAPDQDVQVRGGPDSDGWQAGRVVRRSRGVDLTVWLKALTGGITALQQAGALLDAALATYPGNIMWQPDGSPNAWLIDLPGPLSAGATEYLWERQAVAAAQVRITGSAGPYLTATTATTLTPSAPTNGAPLALTTIAGRVPPEFTITATATNLRAAAWGLANVGTTSSTTAVAGTPLGSGGGAVASITVNTPWLEDRLMLLRCNAATAGTAIVNVYNQLSGLIGRLEISHTATRWRRLPGVGGAPVPARLVSAGYVTFEWVSGPNVNMFELVGIPLNGTTVCVDDVYFSGGTGTVATPLVAGTDGVSYGALFLYVPSTYPFTNGAGAARTGTNVARATSRWPGLTGALYFVGVASDQTFDDRSSGSAHSAGFGTLTVAYRQTEWWPSG